MPLVASSGRVVIAEKCKLFHTFDIAVAMKKVQRTVSKYSSITIMLTKKFSIDSLALSGYNKRSKRDV